MENFSKKMSLTIRLFLQPLCLKLKVIHFSYSYVRDYNYCGYVRNVCNKFLDSLSRFLLEYFLLT